MPKLAPSTVIDRKYEIVRELGQGAMGTVYEAKHKITERRVALKVMKEAYANSPEAAQRFLREVRLATELRHPHVVEVIDAGHDLDGEHLYIAMELLHGTDLERELGTGKMTPAQGLRRLVEILPALAYAHVHGVVHRDLKPENLFVATLDDGTERVKLLDFGIARMRGGKSVTQTGMTVGTPLYMSPEQALRPQEVDHRADLWAVGVMIYELVAGEPPFDDESPHALVLRAAAEPHVPLCERIPNLDPRLGTIVDRCLDKERDERPDSADEVREVLEAVLADATNEHLTVGERVPSLPPEKRATPAGRQLAATALARLSSDGPKKHPDALVTLAEDDAPEAPPAERERRGAPWTSLAAGALVLGLAGAGAVWWGLAGPSPERAEPAPAATPPPIDEPSDAPTAEPVAVTDEPSVEDVEPATDAPAEEPEPEAAQPADEPAPVARRAPRARDEPERAPEEPPADLAQPEPADAPETVLGAPPPVDQALAAPNQSQDAVVPEPPEPAAEPSRPPPRRRSRRRRRPAPQPTEEPASPPPFSF